MIQETNTIWLPWWGLSEKKQEVRAILVFLNHT